MKNKRAIGFVAAGLIAGLAFSSLGIASAATSAVKSTATSSTATTATGQPVHGGPGRGGPAGGPGGGVMGKPGYGGEGDIAEALAALSGLSVDEVNSQRAADKSFADIAKAEGVSTATLIAKTIEIEKEECNEGVTSGKITSAERAKVLADIESRLKTAIADTTAMSGPGGHGPAASTPSTDPSTATP